MHLADSHVHYRDIGYPAISRMLDTLHNTGVREVALLSLPFCSVAYDLAGLYAKMKYKKMPIRVMGGLHCTDRYSDVSFEKQVEALLKLGCDGIKIMEAPDSRAHRGYGLNDSRFEAMFALLEKEQIPINIHCADPEEFWLEGGCYYGGNFISKEQHYKEVFEVLDRHPRLKVCFAHFFFLSNYPEEAERVMNKYPNVYFDLTPGTEMYYNFDKNIPFWQCFFKKYSHRILHGTDANTYKDFNPQLEALVYRKLTEKGEFTQNCYGKDFTVSGLALDNKTVENISFNNYFRFFGSEPKNVDEKFFYKCCEKVLNDITAEPTDEHYKRSFSLIPWLKDDPTQQRSMDFLKYALGNK